MLNLREFLAQQANCPQLQWEENPKLGWWQYNDPLPVYHGTHIEHLNSILQYGLNRADQTTGMISLAMDPYTALAYASMSGAGGEWQYKNGNKFITPNDNRVVIKFRLPRNFVEANYDPRLTGNKGICRDRMIDKKLYLDWKEEGKSCCGYYSKCEIRIQGSVPPEYAVGWMKKQSD